MKTKTTTVHEWEDFSKDFPNSDTYLPKNGDGENKGTQASTALCKLVYRWFNDGDVFDNTHHLEGWANDISGSANWLYNYIPECRDILNGIKKCTTEDDYTNLLYDLCASVDPMIPDLLNEPRVGNAYDEYGPFVFEELCTCSNCGCQFHEDEMSIYDKTLCQDCYEEFQNEDDEED